MFYFGYNMNTMQRRVHSEKLHSTLNSKAKGGLGLVHSTPYEVVE